MNGSVWRLAKGAAAALVVTLAVASEADAFDGERHGFHLEFGLGAGSAPVERSRNLDWSQQSVHAQASPVIRFRAGWGIGHRLLLQYVGDLWLTTTDYAGHINSFYTTGAEGIGATYFFRNESPAVLLEAGVGHSSADAGSSSRGSGLCVWGGVGYEPWRGWLARFTLGSDGAADDMAVFGADTEHDKTIAALTFSRVWY